jgi:hypothetical protein
MFVVQRRYAASIKSGHEKLAEYFLKKADPEGNFTFTGIIPRAFQEVAYHMCLAEKIEQLTKIMSCIECIFYSISATK